MVWNPSRLDLDGQKPPAPEPIAETEEHVSEPAVGLDQQDATRTDQEPWNGSSNCSFGPIEYRSWEDAVRFGFISGGGGAWYSRLFSFSILAIVSGLMCRVPDTWEWVW